MVRMVIKLTVSQDGEKGFVRLRGLVRKDTKGPCVLHRFLRLLENIAPEVKLENSKFKPKNSG